MSTLAHLGEVAHGINQDYPHDIGVAIIYGRTRGSGWAIVDQASGSVIVWDGGYSGPEMDPRHLTPLVELEEWIDPDMMRSQMILDRSAAWLGELAITLLPSYSFDVLARETLKSWGPDETPLGRGYHVVAYFPTNLTHTEAMELARS